MVKLENYNRTLRVNFPILLLFVMPYFKPSSFDYIASALDTVFNIWIIAASIAILILYLINGVFSKYMFAVITFEGVLTLSTIINSGDMYSLISNVVKIISICMLVELGIHDDPKGLVRAFVWVLGIECIINAITVFLFPDGMYTSDTVIGIHHIIRKENYFLGYDNLHIVYLLPFLVCFWIYSIYMQRVKIMTMIYMVLVSLSVFICRSATSVIVITIFFLLALLSENRLTKNRIDLKKGILVIAFLFLILVIFRLQKIFAGFFDILNKDITFTERTPVWDAALRLFRVKPMLGYGQQTELYDFVALGGPHTHDWYLHVLYQMGVVGLGLLIYILLQINKSLSECKNKKYGNILSVGIFSFLIAFLAESYVSMTGFWALVSMAYHISTLTEGLEGLDTNKVRYRLVFRRSVSFRKAKIGVRKRGQSIYVKQDC